MSGFKPILDATEEVSQEEPTIPSKALIACDGKGHGIALAHIGTSITWHIETYSAELGELGLDEAPKGITIWEGSMGSVRVNTMDGEDWDFVVDGDFRDLTQEEWITLSKTGEPWERK